MSPFESPQAWLFYGAILALILIVGVEIYLRVKYANLLWIQIYPQVYSPDDDLGYRYRPNAAGEIRIPGISRRFRINNRGFNGRDFVVAKPPGIFRIAVVGTSNTTGIWMNGGGKNFCEMLEEQLRAAGHQVEVMNFGIDGRYRALHEVRIIETDVIGYDPDLVLMDVDIPFVYGTFRRDVYRGYVMIYSSESESSRKWCEAMVDEAQKFKVLGALYYVSYIVRAAVRYYMNRYVTWSAILRLMVENRVQAPDVVVLPYSLKKSVEALQRVRNQLTAQGGELVIFQYFPNPYYRQVTGKYGLNYLELDVPPIPQYVHDRDGHYRQQGHVEVARQLFDRLIERETFSRKRSDRGAADVSGVEQNTASEPQARRQAR